MEHELTAINLQGVNCYMFKTANEFVLIDTGFKNKRDMLEKELANAGCKPGDLKLIILTHGDSDHTDNAAYLREKYGAKIAMHRDDAGMVENGNMGWNRKAKADHMSLFFKIITRVAKAGKFATFKPDLYIDESFDLSAYGLDARVLHLPDHSKGSIGVLTTDGELFCGDLLYNFFGRPNSQYIDDLAAFNASIDKIKKLNVKTIYPGHGKPFPLRRIISRGGKG